MESNRKLNRSIIAGAAGNVMEWFDFAVYGFFAPIIGQQFFPNEDPVASLLAAFTVFASGFLARPFGAAFFGHLGDRYSRKIVLRASVYLMGIATVLLGLLPPYASIGVAAPILLTVLRIAQGFSVGGEYTGSIVYLVERAPAGKRGFVGGWTNFGAVAGFLLGSAMGALISFFCSPDALASWGWRIPFLLGVSIAAMAAFFRKDLDENPPAPIEGHQFPLVESVKTQWRTMLRICGIILMGNVGFYMMFVYVTTFLSQEIGVPMAEALEINTFSMSALLLVVPIAGWLSDRVGRKPVLLTASVGCFFLALPLFFAIQHDNAFLIFAGQVGFAIILGLSFGPNAAVLVEITEARLRCTTISVSYNLTLAIFGGTTPIVASWLIHQTSETFTPAYYVMVMAAVTALVVSRLPETAHQKLQ